MKEEEKVRLQGYYEREKLREEAFYTRQKINRENRNVGSTSSSLLISLVELGIIAVGIYCCASILEVI